MATGEVALSTTTPENPSATSFNELTPSKVKRVLPMSPVTPRIPGVPSPSRRDFKVLYEELKRKTLEYSKKMDVKLAKHQSDFDALSKKYEEEMNKLDYSERDVDLAANLELQKKYDHQEAEHEKNMNEKNAIIKELNARLEKLSQSNQSVVKMCNVDVFVAKLKKG